ncbi:MAG TPA: hypothetical protein VFL93_00265 [Longimicrobiaceae bacterium]|nr:hypothetical protein [Longimicrobiaceae bacterium]
MEEDPLQESQLTAIEERRDPASIPELVRTIRAQQHDLDQLRLSLDVARRDREELRLALIHARAEIRRLSGGGERAQG